MCPLSHYRRLSALFSIQLIGCQICSSAYQRHGLWKNHLCYSGENNPVAKGTPPTSSQGSGLLFILGNYPLIFLKNLSRRLAPAQVADLVTLTNWFLSHREQYQGDTHKYASGLMMVVFLLRISISLISLLASFFSEGNKFVLVVCTPVTIKCQRELSFCPSFTSPSFFLCL